MQKFRVLAVILVIAVALSGAVMAQDQNIVELAASNPDLSTLVSLVEAAGLVETLSGEGPFTVFAPTNDAFAALPDFVVEYVTSNPEVLTAVLTYHVVAGAAVSSDQVVSGPVASVNGAAITLTVNDMGVYADQAQVITADVMASNGVVHVIDSVIVPPIAVPEIIAADVTGDIVNAGSSTVFPVSQFIAAEFAAEGFTGEITVDSIGSGAGYERFCAAEIPSDIANASRAIRQSEIDACAANGRVPVEFRVGDDGLSVVVNPANDWADDLTLAELALAFSTAVTWADVRPGFPECEIVRYSPGTDSGTFDFFTEVVFDEDTAPILAASQINLNEDDNVLLDGVAQNECAIGYFGYAYYVENVDRIKLVAVDGVAPTADSVASGAYVLARPLFIYTSADVIAEKPHVGQYLLYYMGRVPDAIDTTGYFPANPYVFNVAKLLAVALVNTSSGSM
ncbi:MAG: phosphate ABC transporter substrate-binding protein PstS family protein [Chloroflexi bacterium]|nr:phosphate ABC transporter substrate-binding protein PstS family protein [Chloroflexota bacterium]